MVIRSQRQDWGSGTITRRTWIAERRIHHGLIGLLFVIAGIFFMLDDRRDFPWMR